MLLKIKKLISYKDSKIFKRDIKFTILINKIEINLNNTRQFIKTIFLIRPKVFVIENVKGLFSQDKSNTIQHIINLLSKDQIYNIEFELINMADYGIPQKRVRLFIIGSLKSANLPKYYEKQVLSDVLMDVPVSEGA